MSSLISMGQKAKEASYELGVASPGQKNEALTFMAEELIKAKEIIENRFSKKGLRNKYKEVFEYFENLEE